VTKATDDKREAEEAKRHKFIVDTARQYAPTIHLFIWSVAARRFPGIHPSEVYRAVMADPGLSFDGKTSVVTVCKEPQNKEA
jgi:hypothetical protein